MCVAKAAFDLCRSVRGQLVFMLWWWVRGRMTGSWFFGSVRGDSARVGRWGKRWRQG